MYQQNYQSPINESIPQTDQNTRRMVALPTSSPEDQTLDLSPKLKLDINEVLGQQIAIFGLPGFGKTNALALLIEQIGLYLVPCVIFDKEGDYKSAVEILPRGVLATRENCPSGYDVLNQGLQVVYDLASWGDSDSQAHLICTIVDQLSHWANARPSHERVPCMIVLDEAHHWLPQYHGNTMSKSSFTRLYDTFHDVGSMGRKRGLTPVYACPKISELAKSILYPGIYWFFRTTLHTDIERYLQYIHSSDLTKSGLTNFIKSLPIGKAVVVLPNGKQMQVAFHKRQSEHVSTTPTVQAALNRYANLPTPGTSYGAFTQDDEIVVPEILPVTTLHLTNVKMVRMNSKARLAQRDRVAAILETTPDITTRELGDLARTSYSDAKYWRTVLAEQS